MYISGLRDKYIKQISFKQIFNDIYIIEKTADDWHFIWIQEKEISIITINSKENIVTYLFT